MAVGTNIVWNTEPVIVSTSGSANDNGPLFLACFTAPKGPEDLRIVTGDFDSLYGNGINFSFEKYGQPYLQARRIIANGGRLLCRRLVHENATYGNLIIGAAVTTKKAQKTNEDGELLYKETAATVAAKYEPSMITSEGGTRDKVDENGNKLYTLNGGDGTEISEDQIDENGRLEDGSIDPEKYTVVTETIPAGDPIQNTNEAGELLYKLIGGDGTEVTEAQFVANVVTKTEALMEDGKTINPAYEPDTEEVKGTAEITLYASSMEGVKDINKIKKDLESIKEENPTIELPIDGDGDETFGDTTVELYPLFAVMDNGRGNTGKRVRIDFKSIVSNTNRQAIYTMTDVENSIDIITTNFTLDPDAIFNGKSYAISKETNPQFICAFSEGGYLGFINKISEITGRAKAELRKDDLLSGKTYKGEAIPGVVMGANSLDLSYSLGLSLFNGEDGDEDINFGSPAYNLMTEKFFKPDENTDGEAIYNTDIYKIDVVADANYSMQTKENIVELAEFRKDFFFFRDLGLNVGDENRNTQLGDGLKTYAQVEMANKNDKIVASKFAGTYCTSYNVYDPYTQKPVHVTCIYSIVDDIISHFITSRHLPFAGYTVTDYIEGTIDFVPKQTPKVNQKELLEAIKVNCLTFTSLTNFMVETMMTSTPVDGQLNYIQNVLAVQHVIKDIRTYCPMHRNAFNGSGDFEKYANDIYENVLINHSSKFAGLDFVYDNEDDELSNGEFIASLIFSFNRHIQSETFNIFAED